jgi:alpha-glucosidase
MEQTQLPLWWQRGVIYEIYPRSFQDSNDDGIGDLEGIRQRLPYLVELGIDAIWICPFYQSPMRDFGYDVADYYEVDPIFGTLADFDRLLQSAHELNLKVMIDFVPNHTSSDHSWFIESRTSRTNPKRDWYIWKDAKPDGSPPNNWIADWSGSAWEWDDTTQQYYLHLFLKEMPDLNWRNPEVVQAMLDVLRFWLQRGVDGFRMDVVYCIMKDPQWRDNPLNTGKPRGNKSLGWFDTQVHLYDRGHSDVHGILRQFRRLLDEYSTDRPRFSIGEIFVSDWQEWASYYGQGDELHMPFNFALMNLEWHPAQVRSVIETVEQSIASIPNAFPNYVLGNHDDRRLASRLGLARARAAMLLLLTLRGTPTLYYGDELGMTDGIIPPEREQDPWGKFQPGLGRDPARTPMQWDSTVNAGFCGAEVQPWLPVCENFTEINVADQQTDRQSMLTFTKRLLQLRRTHTALTSGTYRTVYQDDRVLVFERHHETEQCYVAINFSVEAIVLELPILKGKILLSTHCDRHDELFERLELRANEGLIL